MHDRFLVPVRTFSGADNSRTYSKVGNSTTCSRGPVCAGLPEHGGYADLDLGLVNAQSKNAGLANLGPLRSFCTAQEQSRLIKLSAGFSGQHG